MSDSVAGKYLASTPQLDEAIHPTSRFHLILRCQASLRDRHRSRSRQETVPQMLAQAFMYVDYILVRSLPVFCSAPTLIY